MSIKKICALLLCFVMALTLVGCKSKAVRETEKLINAIGTVTVESEEAVKAAEAAYEALSEEDRAEVENYQTLTDARTALDAAKLEALRQALLGTWSCDCDIGPILREALEQQVSELGMSVDDYAIDYQIKMDLTFNEDGTYAFAPDQDSKTAATDKLSESVIPFVRDMVFHTAVAAVKEQGLSDADITNWDELADVLGMGEDEFFQMAYEMTKEDFSKYFVSLVGLSQFAESLSMEGKYQAEEGRLCLSSGKDAEATGDRAVTFSLGNGVMQWTNGTLELTDPLDYPLTFTKNA